MKMALNTEDQEWVKEDIWASVVYLSRDCVSPRGLSRFGKCKSWSCWEAKSAAESMKCNGRLREETTAQGHEWLWSALLWFFTLASHRERLKGLCGDSKDKEADLQGSAWTRDLQGQGVTITARKAPAFGKTLKYKVRSWSVGHLGSQRGSKSHRKQGKCVRKEGREGERENASYWLFR